MIAAARRWRDALRERSGRAAALRQPRFRGHGMELRFLSSYTGAYPHMLHALAHAAPDEIRADVLAQCELVP